MYQVYALVLSVVVFFGLGSRAVAQISAASGSVSGPAVEAPKPQDDSTAEMPVSKSAQAALIGPQLKWSGEVRYRFNHAAEGTAEKALNHQLRARLNLKAKVDEQWQAQVRFTTAESAISGNQSLGDKSNPGFVRRPFDMDIASLIWTADASSTLSLGRVPNPFWHPGGNQLSFDSDLNFEGLSAQYTKDFDGIQFFSNAGLFLISSNYDSTNGKDTADLTLPGLQVGAHIKGENTKYSIHSSLHSFENIKGAPISQLSQSAAYDKLSQPTDRYRGNSIDAVDPSAAIGSRDYRITNKFVIATLGIETTTKLSDYKFNFFADLSKNTAVSANSSASEIGLKLSDDLNQYSVAWIRKEADSVIGAYSDSDSNGGGTDNQGSRISYGRQMGPNASFLLSHFNAQRGISATQRNYQATFLDVQLKF